MHADEKQTNFRYRLPARRQMQVPPERKADGCEHRVSTSQTLLVIVNVCPVALRDGDRPAAWISIRVYFGNRFFCTFSGQAKPRRQINEVMLSMAGRTSASAACMLALYRMSPFLTRFASDVLVEFVRAISRGARRFESEMWIALVGSVRRCLKSCVELPHAWLVLISRRLHPASPVSP